MRAMRKQNGMIFQSRCVTVVQCESLDYEQVYAVYLWDDDCGCEDGCPVLTPALEAIGPWAARSLPISEAYVEVLGATVLTVAHYAV